MNICPRATFARFSEIEFIIMDNILYAMIIYSVSKRNTHEGAN